MICTINSYKVLTRFWFYDIITSKRRRWYAAETRMHLKICCFYEGRRFNEKSFMFIFSGYYAR